LLTAAPMSQRRPLLFALLSSFSLFACSAPAADSDDGSEAQSESLASALTIAATAGGVTTKSIAVSGATRLSTPETYDWSCGRSNSGWYSSPSNVAWVEVKNPTPDTASVSIELTGPSSSNELFAYGSKNAALTDCRSFGRNKLTGSASVVIAPGKSAWVLVDVGTSTGVFQLQAKTERLATVKPAIAIAPAAGGKTDVAIAFDGEARQSTPETYDWSCGRSNSGWYSSPSNVAWVEVTNPTSDVAAVTVEALGLSSSTKLFAYDAKTAASTDCLSFGTNGKLTGSRSLVLGAGESAWVLVDGDSRTGLATLRVTTDRLADAKGTVTIAATEGGSVTTAVALDGRTRVSTPETYDWSCGRSNSGWYSSPSNVAWVEIANPSTSAASLSVTGTKRMFAYASKSAAPTDCISFTTSGALSGSRSVVVEPNASVWLLLDGNDDTGVVDIEVTTDALVEP
jgi:hypothetical protein